MRCLLISILLSSLLACGPASEVYDPSSIYQQPESPLATQYSPAQWAALQAIANRDVSAIDSLPDSLNFFEVPDATLSSRWLTRKGAIFWGEFRLDYDVYSDLVLLSFDSTGQVLDQVWVHYLERQNNEWNRFHANYYYTPDSDVVIEALDMTVAVDHPNEGTALKHWRWSIDPETGHFEVLTIEVEASEAVE